MGADAGEEGGDDDASGDGEEGGDEEGGDEEGGDDGECNCECDCEGGNHEEVDPDREWDATDGGDIPEWDHTDGAALPECVGIADVNECGFPAPPHPDEDPCYVTCGLGYCYQHCGNCE